MLISLIVPTCNKEDAAHIFQHTIKSSRELASYDMEIIFVNDGSTDTTAQDHGVTAASWRRAVDWIRRDG